MNFTFTYEVLKLDKGRFTKALDKAIQEQMKEAYRAFLKAAIKKVPILTGMSRGAFIRLGDFVDEEIPIPGAKPKPSRNPGKGYLQSSIDLDNFKSPNYRISYKIDVFQYNFWDPDNWRATAAGRKALEKYFDKNFARNLPKIVDYITKSTVEFTSV